MLFEKRRLQLYVDAGVRKIKTIKSTIDMLAGFGIPLEKIKTHIKKEFPDDVFFEEDIRDPRTNELLDDCVLAQDARYYNRSTLIELYKQALQEGSVPLCLKDPSGELLNPAQLPTNSILQAKLQMLRKAGLSAAFSPSARLRSEESVSDSPDIKLVEKDSPLEADQKQKFLVSSGDEYYSFFRHEKEPARQQELSVAERINNIKPQVDVVVGKAVTQRIRLQQGRN